MSVGADSQFGNAVQQDFSTPLMAIRSLQRAYRNRDIEAAVRCQDFVAEAQLMFRRCNTAHDSEMVERAARSIERRFRLATQRDWPVLDDIESEVLSVDELIGGLYVATESGQIGPGSYVRLVHMTCTNGQWKVLGPLRPPDLFSLKRRR